MVSSLRSGRNVNYRILDVDWCTSDKVILASDDGCIRVLEMSMKPSCIRMDEQDLLGMLISLLLFTAGYFILKENTKNVQQLQ